MSLMHRARVKLFVPPLTTTQGRFEEIKAYYKLERGAGDAIQLTVWLEDAGAGAPEAVPSSAADPEAPAGVSAEAAREGLRVG